MPKPPSEQGQNATDKKIKQQLSLRREAEALSLNLADAARHGPSIGVLVHT